MITIAAILIMLFLPLLLGWVPVPGLAGFIAGALGGYLIGRPARAFTIALLPFILLGALIVLIALGAGAGWGVSWLGALGTVFAGLAVIWLIMHNIAMLFGAVIGGLLRERTARKHEIERREWPELPGEPWA